MHGEMYTSRTFSDFSTQRFLARFYRKNTQQFQPLDMLKMFYCPKLRQLMGICYNIISLPTFWG